MKLRAEPQRASRTSVVMGRCVRRDDNGGTTPSQHPQRLHVGFQNGFLLGAFVGVLLAQTHDGAQRLDIETVAFAFGIDVADVVGDGLLFFFQPLDALDDGLQLVFCKSGRGRFLNGGGRGHRVLLGELTVEDRRRCVAAPRVVKMTLKFAARSVKKTSRSSTARPQEKAVETSLRANGSRECAPDDRLLALTKEARNQCPLGAFFIASSCSGVAVP